MVATIDIKYMQQRYQGAQLHSDAMMTLSSLDGYIYTRLPEQRTLLGRYVKNYVKPANTENKTIVTREISTSRKISNIVISRRIGPYPLVVSISVPESSLLMTWHQSVMQFIILGVVVSGMILYLTHRVARYQNKQREIKIELKNQATTDPLTGLTNRRYVLEQAAHEIKKARRTGAPLSFILMDLDHFKVVNDSYGHDIGDKVLRKTANILKNMCREADIVSRYGGEEFLLVLPDTDMDGALVDAERVRKTLAETSYRHSKKTFTVTASFGVSQWAEYENDHTEAMRRADKALYKVKNLGRNDVDFQATASVTPLRARKKIVCNKSEE